MNGSGRKIFAALMIAAIAFSLGVKLDAGGKAARGEDTAALALLPNPYSIIEANANDYSLEYTDKGLHWSHKTAASPCWWTPLGGKFDVSAKRFNLKFMQEVYDEAWQKVGNHSTFYFTVSDSQGYSVMLQIIGSDLQHPAMNGLSLVIHTNALGGKPWGTSDTETFSPADWLDGKYMVGVENEVFYDKELGFMGRCNGELVVLDTAGGRFKTLREQVGFAEDGLIKVTFFCGSFNGFTSDKPMSMYVTELNGQSLVRVNSQNQVVKTTCPVLDLTEIPGAMHAGTSITFTPHAYDIIDKNLYLTLRVRQGARTVKAESTDLSFAHSEPGYYTLTFKAMDVAGNVTSKNIELAVKDKFTAPSLTVAGEYPSTINSDEKLTILGFTAQDDEHEVTTTIQIIQNKVVIAEVGAGDELYLPVPGVMLIRYTAADHAFPEPNLTVAEFEIINVIVEKPTLVVAGFPETFIVNNVFALPVAEAKNKFGGVDVSITVKTPGGITDRVRGGSYTPTEVGVYTFTYTARDTYGNYETAVFELNVTEKGGGGCKSSAGIISGGSPVIWPGLAGLALICFLKLRKNRPAGARA